MVSTVELGDLRQFQGNAQEKYIAGVRLLESYGLKTSTTNLKKLGLGNSTISKWRKYYKTGKFPDEKQEEVKEVAVAPAVPMQDDDLDSKVIVPALPEPEPRSNFQKGIKGTNEHKVAAKLANAERTKRKRDEKTFGETNVATVEECKKTDGNIQKRIKLSKGRVRDICKR